MIYQGNKARLRKDILPILQNCIDTHKIKGYVEPFVGGANIIDHIQKSDRKQGEIAVEKLYTLGLTFN